MQAPQTWKEQASEWFSKLQMSICNTLENIERLNGNEHAFQRTAWTRSDPTQPNGQGGGGTMSVLRGDVFEKAGVNFSTVYGKFPEQFSKQIPGTEDDSTFWASGVSLVIHPKNPYVPIVHANTRMITTKKTWFGGGADLTPVFPFEEDTKDFHQAFETMCNKHDPKYYPEFKKWCDEYFFIKHRNEPRGIGGIFYDYQFVEDEAQFKKLFSFTQDVGKTFESIYNDIVQRHFQKPYGETEEDQQSFKRSRYVEFNLVYDRGTQFGFQTNGNTEAILMSMPPKAVWK
ncbi:MAG: Oxygen-dependent coproporphyrinogen-III oxidase [Holosporales bacterium]